MTDQPSKPQNEVKDETADQVSAVPPALDEDEVTSFDALADDDTSLEEVVELAQSTSLEVESLADDAAYSADTPQLEEPTEIPSLADVEVHTPDNTRLAEEDSFDMSASLEEGAVEPASEESAAPSLMLEEVSEQELESFDLDDENIPEIALGFAGNKDGTKESFDDYEEDYTKTADDFYIHVLSILFEAEDLGIDATAKARLSEMLKQKKLPQLIARDLIKDRIVNSVQLARAIARSQKRKEITSFLNVPAESTALRDTLDVRVANLLRNARVIPLWFKENEDAKNELHLAYEKPVRDLILEAGVEEFMHNCKFVWHFAMRDVCGAFWLAGEDKDVDSSMEAEALLDRIVGNAIDSRSSDIHVDPSIKGDPKAIVKYRVDGFVQSKEVITLDQLDRLRVRIENIARMPKVDLHHPNKGAFSRSGFDWRVQIQPHAGRQGPLPRIVIRRLQPDVLPMETLGYPDYFIEQIKAAAQAPNGVIFWTGPTGSGKTESIHSAVVSVNPMGRGLSVHTIEDPPEKRVPGYAVQMEIAESDPARSGLELMKSSLRADPDVVIFGEVRDSEMAGLVFEAANTGHLVFSTLHTNTSLDAIIRLDELGAYGFMVSYVRGIAAQRLVRRVCTHCRIPMETPDEYTQYIFQKYEVELEGAKLFQHDPNGCASCNHTGYHGRIAIAEWLKPNKELIDASTERNYLDIEGIARRSGWRPMGYMGVLHVKNGITDAAELSKKVLELSGDLL